ncbi:MAG: RNA methyltransferase [Saprospirales bacterium]|nr:MAG: RNA methyltransferase [Saprospirales bacterium]
MLSNQKIKFIQSLSRKKFRELHNAYVIEGTKIVETALSVCPEKVKYIFLLEDQLQKYSGFKEKIILTDQIRIKKISNHLSPSPVIALMDKGPKGKNEFSEHHIKIFLDSVQDPGNVGSIIRTCDWYGIKEIILSSKCADVYSPKVLQSAMGSHFAMNIHRLEINELTDHLTDHLFIGADMDGNASFALPEKPMVLCMGSEGSGLSDEVKSICHSFCRIQGSKNRLAESLNVSVAAGILLDRLF